MTPSTAHERRLAWFAWLAVCLIWGTTYLGIRVSLETMPPMIMAGLRWTLAGGLLAAYMATRGERLPRPRGWRNALVLGFLMLVLGNGGVVAGVEGFRKDGERMTWRTAAGFVLGFLGIVLLIWPELWQSGTGGHRFVLGVIALQVACLGWSIGSSYSKRHGRSENVFSATAAQMLAGGVMMLAIGTVRGEWAELAFSTRSALAFGYLTTVGAIGGFVAYTYALRHLPVSLVSLYAYINPVIAVALGVAVLGEPFTSRMAIAAALVFGGVAIVRAPRGSAQARTHVKPLSFRPDAR